MKQKSFKLIPFFRFGIKKPLLTINLALIVVILSTMQVKAIDLRAEEGNKNAIKKLNATTLVSDNSISVNSQQQVTVTGTVKDEDGTPMPGVNIVVDGTTIGVITDVNGKYSINSPRQKNAVLSLTRAACCIL